MSNTSSKQKKYIDEYIHLSLRNRSGSVEHYYHFLLGFLVPLTLTREKILNSSSIHQIFVRSCAILDCHIKAVGFPEIVILDKLSHEIIKLDGSTKQADRTSLRFIETWGYDDPANFSYMDFCKATSVLTTKLSDDIAKVDSELTKRISGNYPNVILINREAPHQFYLSEECEIKTAGTTRRSIQNFDELHKMIASKYPNTLSVTLEDKPLAYQIALFKHADIIVAQHGAALANLIWCNPSTTLIEMHPNDMPSSAFERSTFQNLAKCMKMHYQRVSQENHHSKVEISLVLECIKKSELL